MQQKIKMPLAPLKHIEQEMVRKISFGDQKSFEGLYHLYYKRLCQFAFLVLHSKELSEEVVSDVFLNVWIKREQLNSERNIRSFLYTAVRNRAIDYQRSKPVPAQDNINVYELEMECPEPSADDLIDRELFREHLQQAFDQLPERCRLIARMHYNDELQYKEIAAILNVSRKTVEAQIGIAIRKVKEIFEKYGWS